MVQIDMEEEIYKAKTLIKKPSDEKNVYDSLSFIIKKLLDERPENPLELMEEYLKKPENNSNNQVQSLTKSDLTYINTQLQLFEKRKEEDVGEGGETEEEFEIPLPNCQYQSFLFEQASIGLGREEMQKIVLAMKQLVLIFPIATIRFWGKILGIEKDYIIAEVEFREGEGEDEEELNNLKHKVIIEQQILETVGRNYPVIERPFTNMIQGHDEETLEENAENIEEKDGPTEESELPKSSWKPPPEIPKEEVRSGTNKKVYFVCNYPGDTWTKLPHVTPKEITIARQIKKFLTGSLEAPVLSYPPFPGLEKNYLRAQIARISASTQISPAGYYIFDDEEEEEEDEMRESYTINTEFDGLSLRDLVDPSMSGWVHHTQHILPQGRCTWFNPMEKTEDDFDEEEFDEDEDEDIHHTIPPETGPSLLSTARLDSSIETTPAWSVGISSNVLPEYSVAVAKSNRWPGAYAIAKGRFYENIYVGWAQKYVPGAFTPAQPPSVLDEFVDDEGVTNEMEDPSVEEERALREREEEARREAEEMENLDDDEDDD